MEHGKANGAKGTFSVNAPGNHTVKVELSNGSVINRTIQIPAYSKLDLFSHMTSSGMKIEDVFVASGLETCESPTFQIGWMGGGHGSGAASWWAAFTINAPGEFLRGYNFSQIVTTFAFNIDKQGSSNGSVEVTYRDGTVSDTPYLTQNTSTNAKEVYQTLTVPLLKKPIEKIRFGIWRE